MNTHQQQHAAGHSPAAHSAFKGNSFQRSVQQARKAFEAIDEIEDDDAREEYLSRELQMKSISAATGKEKTPNKKAPAAPVVDHHNPESEGGRAWFREARKGRTAALLEEASPRVNAGAYNEVEGEGKLGVVAHMVRTIAKDYKNFRQATTRQHGQRVAAEVADRVRQEEEQLKERFHSEREAHRGKLDKAKAEEVKKRTQKTYDAWKRGPKGGMYREGPNGKRVYKNMKV